MNLPKDSVTEIMVEALKGKKMEIDLIFRYKQYGNFVQTKPHDWLSHMRLRHFAYIQNIDQQIEVIKIKKEIYTVIKLVLIYFLMVCLAYVAVRF